MAPQWHTHHSERHIDAIKSMIIPNRTFFTYYLLLLLLNVSTSTKRTNFVLRTLLSASELGLSHRANFVIDDRNFKHHR